MNAVLLAMRKYFGCAFLFKSGAAIENEIIHDFIICRDALPGRLYDKIIGN
jgi:hypothetical protein